MGNSVPEQEYIPLDDEDVEEEEKMVKEQTANNNKDIKDSNIAVQIRGLAKTYRVKANLRRCNKCKKTSSYHVLKVNK